MNLDELIKDALETEAERSYVNPVRKNELFMRIMAEAGGMKDKDETKKQHSNDLKQTNNILE